MNPQTARAVAHIVGRLATGKNVSGVFDHTTGEHYSISGQVTVARINIYDYDEGCHISGPGRNKRFSLYHYGNGKHIDLKIKEGGKFSGYDYASGQHFEVIVKASGVSIYDYEHGTWHNYSV